MIHPGLLLGAAFAAAAAVGQAAEVLAPADEGLAEVSVTIGGGKPRMRRLVPGEWVPYTCRLGMPYRSGKTLCFERLDKRHVVRIDGRPPQPAWIHVRKPDDLAIVREALAKGASGFAVFCTAKLLDQLPVLPRERDVALVVSGTGLSLPALTRQNGITGLDVICKDELSDLRFLEAFPHLTSLRLFNGTDVTDLRPLERLRDLRWLRITAFRKLADVAPVAALPRLHGLSLFACAEVADLSPLAACDSLALLRLRGCPAIKDVSSLARCRQLQVLSVHPATAVDFAGLARLTGLIELELSGCGDVADLAPLGALRQLRTLRLTYASKLADLRPLARCATLGHLDLQGCASVKDVAPLARLAHLRTLDLTGIHAEADLRPLRPFVRRGGTLTASKDQLDRLDETDF